MFPLLFEIPIFGGLKIYTYGVLYALGVVAAILVTVREAKRCGIRSDFILDLTFYIILGNLIGARVLYIITEWRRYLTDPLGVFKIWEGGLVFYGGLFGAVMVGFFYIRRHRQNFLQIGDLYMPGLALGHGIGRLGCFAAGCCYGREAPGSLISSGLAVVFPSNPLSLAPAGVPLFPTQLAEAAVLFLISGFLLLLLRKKKFDGQVLLVYLVLYSVARGILEIYRGDSVRGFLIPNVLSTSQFISGLLIILAIVVYLRLKHRTGRLSP